MGEGNVKKGMTGRSETDASGADSAGEVPRLVLASGSPTRAAMLERAAVPFGRIVPEVDEVALRAAAAGPRGGRTSRAAARRLALGLAEAKARAVAGACPDALVLGADQLLLAGGRIFAKPADLSEARAQLVALRGRRHELLSAAVVVRAGLAEPLWAHVGRARLTMRNFSDAFLDGYLARVGELALASVGCYQVEGPGVQLFRRIEGDWFTILGLPLLELLAFLRRCRVVME